MRRRPSPVHSVLAGLAVLYASAALATRAAAQAPAHADSIRLVERMTVLHRAMAAHDAEGWYALTGPRLRAVMTLEQFKADLGLVGQPLVQPAPDVRVTLDRICPCQAIPGGMRCVAVLTAGTEPPPAAGQRWIESWDLMAKEWYWVYGEPHGANPVPQPPRCPGER